MTDTPLGIVLAAVTLLGIYVKGQGENGFGFLTQIGADGSRAPGAAASEARCGPTVWLRLPVFGNPE